MSKIEGLPSGAFNKLRKELSYMADAQSAFFAGGYGPRPKYLIDKQGNFLTGLLARVYGFLVANDVVCNVVDSRRRPDRRPELAYKGPTPYSAQEVAVDALIAYEQGIVTAPTGSGKSVIIALAVAKLNLKTLIVVPNLELKKQLTESLKVMVPAADIMVENIDSKALDSPTDTSFLIIDESHHSAAKTYQSLNKKRWGGIYYRLFLTATPFRNQTEETLLFEGIAGQVIYKLSYADAVKNNQIVPVEAYYLEVPKQTTDAYTWAQVYSELVVKNETRNLMIGALLARLFAAKKSTLCLVKEVAHGQILSDMTGIPFVHGQDEESRDYIRQFNNGGLMAVIATTGMMGEGVDSRPAEFVIIAGLGKAKSQFMQQVGRVLRTYPGKETGKVIIIKDRSHKFTTKHFNEQKKILLDEYGVTVSKLEL